MTRLSPGVTHRSSPRLIALVVTALALVAITPFGSSAIAASDEDWDAVLPGAGFIVQDGDPAGRGIAAINPVGDVVFPDSVIFRTLDAGQSWTPLPPLPLGRAGDLDMADDGTIYWRNEPRIGATQALYRSDDLGLGWSAIRAPQVRFVSDMHALADGTLFVSGNTNTDTTCRPDRTLGTGLVLRSDDGGVRFDVIDPGVEHIEDVTVTEDGQRIALTAYDLGPQGNGGGTGCLYPQDGRMLLSLDGGETFTEHPLIGIPHFSGEDVLLGQTSTGVIAKRITEEGALVDAPTASLIEADGTTSTRVRGLAVDGDRVVALSSNGTIWTSIDQGRTFVREFTSDVKISLSTDVSFIGAGGVMAGSTQGLLRRVDELGG